MPCYRQGVPPTCYIFSIPSETLPADYQRRDDVEFKETLVAAHVSGYLRRSIIADFYVNYLALSISIIPIYSLIFPHIPGLFASNHTKPIMTPRPYFVVLGFLDANSLDPRKRRFLDRVRHMELHGSPRTVDGKILHHQKDG